MKIKLLIVMSIVITASWYQYTFNITPIYKVPSILSSMRAKEFCSCYFLLDNTEKYCLGKVRKNYPFFNYLIEKKSVTFANPISSARSVFISKHLGCTLK